MRKGIIFSSFLLAIIFIFSGLYIWQNQTKKMENNRLQNVKFSSIIEGCANKENSQKIEDTSIYFSVEGCAKDGKCNGTRFFNDEEKDQDPIIKVNESEIIYFRAINHICCRVVEVKKEIKGSVINLYEVWSGPACKCVCFSKVEARVQSVPSGNYVVNVYEKGTKPEGKEPMEEKLIISQKVVIK